MLGRLGSLAEPQRRGLSVAFGLASGQPDRFIVALAALSLAALSLAAKASEERPMVCVVDDAQWLDQASAQVLGFVRAPPAGVPWAGACGLPRSAWCLPVAGAWSRRGCVVGLGFGRATRWGWWVVGGFG